MRRFSVGTLSLGLCLGVAASAVMSTGVKAASITEQDAQSIARDAYLYFYPLVTMDVTRKQLTECRARERARRADEHFVQRSGVSHRRLKQVVSAQFRHAVFLWLARSHQGADGRLGPRHGRALLSAADARHVDGRLRVAGLAHHGNASGQFPRHTAGLERNVTVGRVA